MPSLLERRERYRADSRAEGQEIINNAYETCKGDVSTSLKYKTKTKKGEIIDEWWVAEIIESF